MSLAAPHGDEPLSSGDVLVGRYRIDTKLGEGGTALVYRATQLALDREVALKVLRPRFASDATARARFTREARVASTLRHANAVEIYDYGDEHGASFLAMELLRGATLRASLPPDGSASAAPSEAAARVPLGRVLAVGYQIADVLVAAHALGVVHRDLKPENVFLEPIGAEGRDRVVVVDFGLAFIAGHDELGRHTQEGVVAGTPAYLSPEQARGERVGPPSDVYSLGCVLYELLTGSPPFEGDTARLLSRHLFVPPPPLRERRGGPPLPAVLDALVQRMLRKRAEERPSALVVRTTLESIDPTAIEPHVRGREALPLVGREARMVSAIPLVASDEEGRAADVGTSREIAVLGPLDVELQLALAANAMIVFTVSEERPIAGAAAVFAPGVTPDDARALGAHGLPVVTDADRSDMERVAALLRAGVDEVLMRPLDTEEVVLKLRRAIDRARRRARQP